MKKNKERSSLKKAEHTALRKAMSKLDYAIPDYVFNSNEGSEIAQCISDVWDEIDKIEIDKWLQK